MFATKASRPPLVRLPFCTGVPLPVPATVPRLAAKNVNCQIVNCLQAQVLELLEKMHVVPTCLLQSKLFSLWLKQTLGNWHSGLGSRPVDGHCAQGREHCRQEIEVVPAVSSQHMWERRACRFQAGRVPGQGHALQAPLLLVGHEPASAAEPQTACRTDAAASIARRHNPVEALRPG